VTDSARCGCLHYLPVNVEEPDSPCKNCGHTELKHVMKAARWGQIGWHGYYHPFVFVPCRALVGAAQDVGRSS